MYVVYGEDGRFIAGFSSREEAAQIVAEHNAVPKLVEALDGLRQRHGCFCELPPNAGSPDHTLECDRARLALAATTMQPDAGEGR
jgi:hypothetical protein